MELTGSLKKQVENANSMEEAKAIIEKAGIRLTEDELNKVSGGFIFNATNSSGSDPIHPWEVLDDK